MGVLNRTKNLVLTAVQIGTVMQCSHKAPTAPVESSLAVNITAVTTVTKPPSELVIDLTNDRGLEKKQVINPVPNNGKADFFSVPYGHWLIDINGMSQELRTLYGHGEVDVQAPRASVEIALRNIIGIKNLDAAQEENFFQSVTVRSAFWDVLPKQSAALCTTVDGATVLRATLAASLRYLYFLFEVTDETFYPDNRPATGSGEFTADAVIVYLCKIPPHNLPSNIQSIPAVRFQCEMGRNVPEEGLFNLVNLTNPDNVRNGPLANFTTDEINARILRTGLNQRFCEIRIRKSLLSLPDEERLFGMVVRYRDSDNGSLPAILSDWQTGTVDMNPRQNNAPWGYLELNL